MRIIVTGGAGFIGPHLTDRLISEGHQVMILDDFSAGNEKFVNPRAMVARTDIRDAEKTAKVFSFFKPEAVFHLAAQIDLRKSIENPKEDYEINVVGSKNILESSARHGVKRFVFSSSAAVYGDNRHLPIKETEPVAPENQYGKSKAEIENQLKEYGQKHGIKSVVLRYANVYGPRQGTVGEGGVIAIFCKRLIAGEPLIIFEDGAQTRDFVFVDDVVESNILALRSDKGGAVYNASTAKETSINELAKLLLQISGENAEIKHEAAVVGEVRRSALDNSLIKHELGWSPRVDLDAGLRRTWEWFKERY